MKLKTVKDKTVDKIREKIAYGRAKTDLRVEFAKATMEFQREQDNTFQHEKNIFVS